MGIIISEPLPVEVRIGSKAMMVVAVVITAGFILRCPASTVAALIPLYYLFISIKALIQICSHQYTIVSSYSKRAIKPTQTATLKLIVCIWNKSRKFVPKTEKSANQFCP